MPVAPYGSWPSPISAADLAVGSAGLDHTYGLTLGPCVYWTQSNAVEGGRVALWRANLDTGERHEVAPGRCVRNAINEYGGGAWTAAVVDGHETVVYSDWPSGDLRVVCGGHERVLATGGQLRYGSLSLSPEHGVVLAVREDHRGEGEPVNTVVVLDLSTDNPGGGRVLACGADFYASPVAAPDGRVAWIEWDHPNMPWDHTRLMVTSALPGDGSSGPPAQRNHSPQTRPEEPSPPPRHPDPTNKPIQIDADASILYPSWASDGSLIYLSDASGYWNFRRWDGDRSTPLHDHPWDFCQPMWAPDPPPYCLIDDTRIACSWLEDGFARLGALEDGELFRLDSPAVEATISGHGPRSAVLLGYPDRPCELAVLDWATGDTQVVAWNAAPHAPDLSDCTSLAQPFVFDGEYGPVHAWYYPPANDGYQAPEGELPPVQVWSHGGPTAFSGPAFKLSTQFWTSRGIGILDVNYSGSAGFGRAYRERLKGRWGVADVSDCAQAALALADRGEGGVGQPGRGCAGLDGRSAALSDTSRYHQYRDDPPPCDSSRPDHARYPAGVDQHPLADRARLSIRGSSAGGYTTLAALVFTDVFAAGISLYGIGDLETLATDTHKFESRYLDGLVAPYPQGRQVYLDRSPRYHLEHLSCPMLILQGADDPVVPPEQAYAMAEAVRAKGLPVRLVVFDGEGHGFRKADSIIATAEACLSFLGEVHGFTPHE